jgi:acetylglutamate kinase
MERYELVIQFFREIGAAREAEMYFRLFQKGDPQRFAVIEVAEDLSGFSLNVLALHLAFLSSIDLYPVVVHGAGGAFAAQEIEGHGKKIQGDFWRWLTGSGESAAGATGAAGAAGAAPDAGKGIWQRARDATLALNETLTSAIILHDGAAQGILSGVFLSAPDGAIQVRPDAITRAIKRDEIPVVGALSAGEGRGARALQAVPLRAATEALIRRLKPRKIIRLNEDGGVRALDGSILDYVNLKLDRDTLAESGALSEASARELDRYAELLSTLARRTVIEVTSSSSLLKELFTQKGHGTLIKQGRSLHVHDSFAGLSRTRLRALIERSFGKKLSRRYFTPRHEKTAPIRTVIVDPDYKGLAIIRGARGLDYLDKFAVRPEARGEGIAADLWTMILRNHPRFFWRSRPDNPINGWYFERATGVLKTDEWWIWWLGLTDREALRAARLAVEMPVTLE